MSVFNSFIDSTLPFSLISTLLIFPFLLSYYSSFLITLKKSNDTRWALAAPAINTSIILICTDIVAKLSHNFYIGCCSVLVLNCLIQIIYLRANQVSLKPSKSIYKYKTQLALIVGLGILLAPAILYWDFHDQIGAYSSHFSIVAQLLNGHYPAHDLYFSKYALSYHYGVDILFAIVAFITHGQIQIALDLTFLGCLIYISFIFFELGQRWFNAPITLVIMATLASGLPILFADTTHFTHLLLGIGKVNGAEVNPPLASYIFQPPWTIGIPLFGALLLLLDYYFDRLATSEINRKNLLFWQISFFCCLACLGISNTTLFLSFTTSLIFVELLKLFSKSSIISTLLKYELKQKFDLALTLTTILAAIVGLSLSGFSRVLLKLPPVTSGGAKLNFAGITGNLLDNITWNFASIGLVLPLGIVGIILLRRQRLLLACMAAQGLLAVNIMTYPGSWDIVKFATLAQLILAITAVKLFATYATRLRLLVVLSILICIFTSLTYHSVFWLNLRGNPFPTTLPQNPLLESYLSLDEQNAISWLRKNLIAKDSILSSPERNLAYAYLAGAPQLWTDQVARGLGLSTKMLIERKKLLIKLDQASPQEIINTQVRWIVLNKDSDLLINKVVSNLREKNLAQLATQFGNLQIYKIGINK